MAQLRSALFSSCASAFLVVAAGCGADWTAIDQDGDGVTPSDGDCWDKVEGPPGSGLTGADIYPKAADTMGDGVDQNCDGGLEYDFDGDGHDSDAHGGLDCDDDDAAVNPDAQEICNALDDDCDGDFDDDDASLEPGAWYRDGDDDGYGEQLATAQGCDVPDGYATEGGDCDDSDPTLYPGAEEVCDGIDQDCDDEIDDDATGDTTWYLDADEDGYGDPTESASPCEQPAGYVLDALDCDDADPDIHPGVTERCDEIDQDCDTLVDEDVPDAPVWYEDADADGFGDADSTLGACELPVGYAEVADDCDDASPEVNPDAVEVCNTVDDDCDGDLDSEDADLDLSTATAWYPDGDGDDFGASAGEVLACSAPEADYIDVDGDCDDADGSVYPGAEEICATGRIEDCDLTEEDARASCLTDVLTRDEANAVRYPEGASQHLGETVARAGDVDGDGLDDVLVAGPASTRGIYLLSGPLSVGSSSLTSSVAYTARWTGGGSEELGRGLSGAMDLDGDGYDDVLMGAPGNDTGATNAGAGYVAFGPVSGVSAASESAYVATGSVSAQNLGESVSAGDVLDDDGVDLILGAPGYKSGTASNAGAVYVIAGTLSSGTASLGTAYDARLVGASAGDLLGAFVVAVGDVNADGEGDLLVSASGNDDGGGSAGKVLLIHGPVSSGVAEDLAVFTYRGSAGDEAGTSLAGPGDLDGDGYAELLIGSPEHDGALGSVVMFRGRETLPLSEDVDGADLHLLGADGGDELGASVAGALDLEGDGLTDLAIGAPAYDAGGSGAGAVWLLSGSSSGSLTLGDGEGVLILGADNGEALGTAAAGLGDTDGDGWEDLAVGAPDYDAGSSGDAGALFLFSTWY